jgi:DNA-binding NarL/FixJ family response regulator
MKGNITVLLCDDHTLFREGIKAILKDEPSTGGRRSPKPCNCIRTWY